MLSHLKCTDIARNLRIEELIQVPSVETPARIRITTDKLLGIPYAFNPAGDGPWSQYDNRPIFNLEAVDCLTFVETVMAVVSARNVFEFEKCIRAIRYGDSVPEFTNRYHFIATDWIPNNIRNHRLIDVTAELARVHNRYRSLAIEVHG